jgi:hypothetical protein
MSSIYALRARVAISAISAMKIPFENAFISNIPVRIIGH